MRSFLPCAFLLCACEGPLCPEPTPVTIDQSGDEVDEISELVAYARPSEAVPTTNGGTRWSFTFDDATIVELRFPRTITFPPPPLSGCCDIRLPASPFSVRHEVQVFADDGLWLEISAPRRGRTTDGVHASLLAEVFSECRTVEGDPVARRQILFDFASEPASMGESRAGTLTGLPVRGFVASDFFFGEESGPQAIVGRAGDPAD